jgi:hypothetical protein
MGETNNHKVDKGTRIDRPLVLDWELTIGFFDGASQERGAKCGEGTIIKCPFLGKFRLKMNYRNGINTKGELLALWCILYFACYIKLNRIQLVGDSKIIIDRYTNKCNIQVISL